MILFSEKHPPKPKVSRPDDAGSNKFPPQSVNKLDTLHEIRITTYTKIGVEKANKKICRYILWTFIHSFIHSLVFSLRGRVGRNQSPVIWPVWLWHTASWTSSWWQFAIAFPPFRRSHFRRQVLVRLRWSERSWQRKVELWARKMSGNVA